MMALFAAILYAVSCPSCGANVLVLGKRRDNLLLLSEPLKTDVNKNVDIERLLN